MTQNQIILNSIEKQIKYKRENSLWNHFLTLIRIDSDGLSGKVSGMDLKFGFSIIGWVFFTL
jgi:hypothetical protein